MYTNFLVKLKNAGAAGRKFVKTSHSNADYQIAELLKRNGFIRKVEVKGRNVKRVMELELGDRCIKGLKFVSKPSRRLYAGYKKLSGSRNGRSLTGITTSKGIMSAGEARKQKVGGGVLFEIW